MTIRSVFSVVAALAVLTFTARAKAANFSPPCTAGAGDAAALVTALTTATANNQDDTVTLGAHCIYTLTNAITTTRGEAGLPELTDDGGHAITIVGNGATIKRSTAAAAPLYRIMLINGASVILQNVAISSGAAAPTGGFTDGGGIRLQSGTLDATDVAFVSSVANPASGNGGGLGVRSGAIAHLHRCGFFDNTALLGGGLYNEGGTVTADNVTIATNNAQLSGGGFAQSGGNATFINITVASNIADQNSANAGDGGGIANLAGTVTITSSIVAKNSDDTTAEAGTVVPDVFGTFVDGGHNIVGITDGSTGFTVSTLVGTTATPFDAKLGTLGIEDAPTGTYALLPDSPAINAADSAVCAAAPINGIDQRSRPRPADHCDIGAYELQSVITTKLTAAPNPADFGATVTLTCHATITPIGPTPKAEIAFLQGSTTLGTAAADADGDAVLTIATLTAGSHAIVCSYPGDSTFTAATSDPVMVVINAALGSDASTPPTATPPSATPPAASSGDAGTATTPADNSDSGCGCRTMPAPSSSAMGALGVLGLGILVRRRRRK